MTMSKEIIKEMIREMGGPELSDVALDQVFAEVQVHRAQSEELRQLDLSKVLPSRLMRVGENRRES